MELQEWAQKRLQEELTWTREASSIGRRAWHEGVAAALAFEAGGKEADRARNIVSTIIADYSGVRASQGRAGFAAGVAMIRGVASYLEAIGDATAAAWATEHAAAVDA